MSEVETLRKENRRLRKALEGAWLDYDQNPYQIGTAAYDAQERAMLKTLDGEKFTVYRLEKCDVDYVASTDYAWPGATA